MKETNESNETNETNDTTVILMKKLNERNK